MLLVLAWVAVAAGLGAQTVPPDLPGRPAAYPDSSGQIAWEGYLRVVTDSPDALVDLNGGFVEPNVWHRISTTRGSVGPVRLVRRDRPFDGPSVSVLDLRVQWNDSVQVRLELPVRTRVESLPLRARVSLVRPDGSEEPLGTAPLDVDRPRGERAALVARLDGYAEARAVLDGQPTLTLVLPPGPGVLPPEATVLPVDTRRRARARLAVDVGLVGLAAGAAAFAIDAKFRADRLDDRYRDPTGPGFGDEALRERAVRLDARSLVGLAAMQASLGVFAVRLVLR